GDHGTWTGRPATGASPKRTIVLIFFSVAASAISAPPRLKVSSQSTPGSPENNTVSDEQEVRSLLAAPAATVKTGPAKPFFDSRAIPPFRAQTRVWRSSPMVATTEQAGGAEVSLVEGTTVSSAGRSLRASVLMRMEGTPTAPSSRATARTSRVLAFL